MLLCDDAPGEVLVTGDTAGDTIFENVEESAVTRRAARMSSSVEVGEKKVFGQDGLLATTEKFPLTQDSHVETIEWPQQVSAQTPDDARPRELQLTPVARPTRSRWARTADGSLSAGPDPVPPWPSWPSRSGLVRVEAESL
jgi:hypothetical protein